MPSIFREEVDTASAIKGILDSYPFGNGILRELLQNSDDAGATNQIFILDYRTHGTVSLLDPILAESQGPALLCQNDSLFRDSDWNALQTIHGSNKRAEENKIGKYGLGFRSCYHLTDNPHILSGEKLVIFDPHKEFRDSPGGVVMKLPVEGGDYTDQLSSFKPMLTNNTFYDGTIVRLPLRTAHQKAQHKIRDQSFSPGDIKELFHQFIQTELKVVMLFLKNISTIELREINASGQESTLGKVEIVNIAEIQSDRTFLRTEGARFVSFACHITCHSQDEGLSDQAWRICHSVQDVQETSRIVSKRLAFEVSHRLRDDKLFSHVALAYPLNGRSINGQLFTLLPLPIHTGFPVHAHGILALTPDRQSLRNIEERGSGVDSRENLLVQWNQLVFDTFIPQLWAKLLYDLVHNKEVEDIWTLWPPVTPALGNNGYWANLPVSLLGEVLRERYKVFPIFGNYSKEDFITLSDGFVAKAEEKAEHLKVLAKSGVPVIQPPASLRRLIVENHVIQSQCKPLNASTVRAFFLDNISHLNRTDAGEKGIILDYLSSAVPTSLLNLCGLPLLPLSHGGLASLSQSALASPKYILGYSDVVRLFGNVEDSLIVMDRLPQSTRKLLEQALEARTSFNVTAVRPVEIRKCLNSLLGHLSPSSEEENLRASGLSLSWFNEFWAFIKSLSWNSKEVYDLVKSFHLLPMSSGNLRRTESAALSRLGLDERTIGVLSRLGIPFLHESTDKDVPVFSEHNIVWPSNRISFVLDHISQLSLPLECVPILQDYFLTCARRSSFQTLSCRQRDVFLHLPIFPTLHPNGSTGQVTEKYGAVKESPIYIAATDCPLPILDNPERTYVDISLGQPYRSLLAVSEQKSLIGLNEVEVLELSISVLSKQPPGLKTALLARIVSRIADIPQIKRNLLMSSEVIPVSSDVFRRPLDVIDPTSPLGAMYRGEAHRFPVEPFSSPSLLSQMRAWDLIQSKLTIPILSERIKYLSSSSYGSAQDKAIMLLRMLDRNWHISFSEVIKLDLAWLPANEKLLRNSECRPQNLDTLLFDLVLPIIAVNLASTDFLLAMGWSSNIPTHVLIEQFKRTLDPALCDSRGREQRLKALVDHFSKIKLDDTSLHKLRSYADEKLWIPLGNKEYVSSQHALLSSTSTLDGIDKFRKLRNSYLNNQNVRDFLVKMGCSYDISKACIIGAIQRLASHSQPTISTISSAILLLDELCAQGSLTQEENISILVPNVSKRFVKLEEVCYNDLGEYTVPLIGLCYSHPKISQSLASSLGISFASSIQLGDDDDLDDIQMAEDLCTRIGGVLESYDIAYSFNEFLANAVDAGATRFALALDMRSHTHSQMFNSAMQQAQKAPALLLYNNAMFSPGDFKGLREIGKGGKTANPDSIGKFGLGALSLFHFTDVPMVVSDNCIMVLDPTEKYLPPRPYQKGRRTVLYREISGAEKHGLLSPFEGLWGFKSSNKSYNGTMFRLPLREAFGPLNSAILSTDDVLAMIQTKFYELSRHAFFFTPLRSIEAVKVVTSLQPNGTICPLWKMDSQRAFIVDERRDLDHFRSQSLNLRLIRGQDTEEETWLMTSMTRPVSEVPSEHDSVLHRHKMSRKSSGIQAGIALQLSSTPAPRLSSTSTRKHKLFSSLMLPVETDIPAHIHAQFALSPDRRNIRFDPPGPSGSRLPEAAYNAWLFTNMVTVLYGFTLQTMAVHMIPKERKGKSDIYSWWPSLSADSITIHMTESFYNSVPESSFQICFAADKSPISPGNAVFSKDEPSAVNVLLKTLLRSPTLVTLPSALRKWCETLPLKAVDGSFVRSSIQNAKVAFLRECQKRINSVTSASFIQDLDRILRYLLSQGTSVDDLPLLLLQDGGQLKAHCDLERPLFHHKFDLTSLLPGRRFISRDYAPETVELMKNAIQVVDLDPDAVADFMSKRLQPSAQANLSEDDKEWLERFWQFRNDLSTGFPDPAESAVFSRLPIFPTFIHPQHVSLEHFRQCGIVSGFSVEPWLAAIVQQFGLVIVEDKMRYKDILKGSTFSLSLLVEKSTHSITNLPSDDQQKLAEWIRGELSIRTEEETRKNLRHWPIWPCWKGGAGNAPSEGMQLVAAASLTFLPATSLTPRTILPFLPSSQWFCPSFYNVLLLEIIRPLRKYKKRVLDVGCNLPIRKICPDNILDMLEFPLSITSEAAELEIFSQFLSEILAFADFRLSSDVVVPNGNLVLVPARGLYDSKTNLFNMSFSDDNSGAERFIHPFFRRFETQLHRAGLRQALDFDSFLECVKAIDRSIHDEDDRDLRKASLAFDFYSGSLPQQIMTNTVKWSQLDTFRFIPRSVMRRPNVNLDEGIEEKCRRLPRIVSPQDMVLPQHEKICWSQRARFARLPSRDLELLNSALGIPDIPDVVEHLRVLKYASQFESGSGTLFEDLTATYKWLNDQKNVTTALLGISSDQELFLNVDKQNDLWKWCSADMLAFDLHDDLPKSNLFYVRDHLSAFSNLLRIAGVESLQTPTLAEMPAEATAPDTLRASFDNMRRELVLVDVVFKPTINIGRHRSFESWELSAHRSFLAASVPHLCEALSAGMTEQSREFSFQGSAFAAGAVLNYIYTGDLGLPAGIADMTSEELGDLLEDLLNLLETADRWSMENLKEHIAFLVAQKYSLVTPDTYDTVKEFADLHKAKRLAEFCDEYGEKNKRWIGRVVSESDYQESTTDI